MKLNKLTGIICLLAFSLPGLSHAERLTLGDSNVSGGGANAAFQSHSVLSANDGVEDFNRPYPIAFRLPGGVRIVGDHALKPQNELSFTGEPTYLTQAQFEEEYEWEEEGPIKKRTVTVPVTRGNFTLRIQTALTAVNSLISEATHPRIPSIKATAPIVGGNSANPAMSDCLDSLETTKGQPRPGAAGLYDSLSVYCEFDKHVSQSLSTKFKFSYGADFHVSTDSNEYTEYAINRNPDNAMLLSMFSDSAANGLPPFSTEIKLPELSFKIGYKLPKKSDSSTSTRIYDDYFVRGFSFPYSSKRGETLTFLHLSYREGNKDFYKVSTFPSTRFIKQVAELQNAEGGISRAKASFQSDKDDTDLSLVADSMSDRRGGYAPMVYINQEIGFFAIPDGNFLWVYDEVSGRFLKWNRGSSSTIYGPEYLYRGVRKKSGT